MLKLKFTNNTVDLLSRECLIVLFSSKTGASYLKDTNAELKSTLADFSKKYKKIEANSVKVANLTFDKTILLINCYGIKTSFEALSLARKAIKHSTGSQLSVVSFLTEQENERFVDAITSAFVVADWSFPKYQSKKTSEKKKSKTLEFTAADKKIKQIAEKAKISAESNNLVRELSMRAANDLNPKNYVALLRKAAKDNSFKCEVFTEKKLKTMKAGCFLAVSQASAHDDAAIVKLTYEPKKKTSKSLCLVGKGITYDTGGTCLKPAAYMLGMNADMGGSAVAFATLMALSKMKVDFKVTCYLAIADNDIGSKAFRPNEVVTALNGKTVETIHTDAEGRMVLADTLCLASKEKYNLTLNYATLTGACVKAIGTTFSGVFSHNEDLAMKAKDAGKDSGERVWPFPLDKDFGECLKSDIADIKQCRPSGGVDHIEAAYFLSEFVKDKDSWLHMDLSSIENPGGLAHVGTENTGFGVRFSLDLIGKSGFKI